MKSRQRLYLAFPLFCLITLTYGFNKNPLSENIMHQTPASRSAWVSVGSDLLRHLPEHDRKTLLGDHNPFVSKALFSQALSSTTDSSTTDSDGVLIHVSEDALELLSHHAHDLGRCGGFIYHEETEVATPQFMQQFSLTPFGLPGNSPSPSPTTPVTSYKIRAQSAVKSRLPHVSASSIEDVIRMLSDYHTRHFNTETGEKAARDLADYWQKIGENRSDFSVQVYEHSSWRQPSVIARLQGKSDEKIIIGGHLDSIHSRRWGGTNPAARAPGADDNASGIATITEVLKVLIDSGYRPEKTLEFMGYAAEEVGLRGSGEIARRYKRENKKVFAALQLDMTNFNGNSARDIYLISDNTQPELSRFLGVLIDQYLQYSWAFDRCGYACSDHASWHRQGFAVAYPFASQFSQLNETIHSDRDVIEHSGGHALHAEKFAKLALAFVVEMDKQF